jgi:hypothetical protein
MDNLKIFPSGVQEKNFSEIKCQEKNTNIPENGNFGKRSVRSGDRKYP